MSYPRPSDVATAALTVIQAAAPSQHYSLKIDLTMPHRAVGLSRAQVRRALVELSCLLEELQDFLPLQMALDLSPDHSELEQFRASIQEEIATQVSKTQKAEEERGRLAHGTEEETAQTRDVGNSSPPQGFAEAPSTQPCAPGGESGPSDKPGDETA